MIHITTHPTHLSRSTAADDVLYNTRTGWSLGGGGADFSSCLTAFGMVACWDKRHCWALFLLYWVCVEEERWGAVGAINWPTGKIARGECRSLCGVSLAYIVSPKLRWHGSAGTGYGLGSVCEEEKTGRV